MARTIKVSSKGQVVIPAEIRRELDIGRDSRLTVEVKGDKIVLEPIRRSQWQAYRGEFARGASLVDELEEERRREREREVEKFKDG